METFTERFYLSRLQEAIVMRNFLIGLAIILFLLLALVISLYFNWVQHSRLRINCRSFHSQLAAQNYEAIHHESLYKNKEGKVCSSIKEW